MTTTNDAAERLRDAVYERYGNTELVDDALAAARRAGAAEERARIRAEVEGQLKGKHTDAFDEGADAAYRDVLAILDAETDR